jgi:hypothetical protein
MIADVPAEVAAEGGCAVLQGIARIIELRREFREEVIPRLESTRECIRRATSQHLKHAVEVLFPQTIGIASNE